MLFEQDELASQGIGISEKMKRDIFSLMVEFNQLDLDMYETALVAALCATSPDRGIQENFDYRILAATQVKYFHRCTNKKAWLCSKLARFSTFQLIVF